MQHFITSAQNKLCSGMIILHDFYIVRGSDRCKLFCRVEDSSAYYLLGASVVDGTPCGADTFDSCVNGQCVLAGCDHVLGSGMKLGILPPYISCTL